MAHDRAQELETVLLKAEEERERMQSDWDKDKEHFSALIGNLRRESRDEISLVSGLGVRRMKMPPKCV